MSNVERFWCHEARNIRCVREADYDALRAENERWRGLGAEQHARDSVELRRLCQERDQLRASLFARSQDVSGLVDALREIIKQYPNPNIAHVDYRVHASKHAEAALAAHKAGGAAPPGWILVPPEPTAEMCDQAVASDALDQLSSAAVEHGGWPYSCKESREFVGALYRAMVATATKTVEAI